ncbi:MAG: HlyD family efflux transporter periplasmic adaptor subunit [candidate division Zixibacteria bacterium]|nr:HlyD family efflux transporter periplasmic adaptor subunit [candidate division Zixibacteria bacterium]
MTLCAGMAGCASRHGKLLLSGTLETDDHDLIAPFTARILAIAVREGDRVKTGDTIAVMDTLPVAAAYRAAQAAQAEAEAKLADLEFGSDREKIRAAAARVDMARSDSAQGERDWRRADSLFDGHLIDAQSYERAKVTRDNAAAATRVAREQLADLERGTRLKQIDAAKAAVAGAAETLRGRRHDFEQSFLVAPHDGVVQYLPYQAGEFVPVGRAVATIQDPDDLWAKVYVPEDRLDEVKVGDSVRFTVDADRRNVFGGTVVFIAARAEFTPRNVQTPDERLNLVFAVKIMVRPGQYALRAGMPADFAFN